MTAELWIELAALYAVAVAVYAIARIVQLTREDR